MPINLPVASTNLTAPAAAGAVAGGFNPMLLLSLLSGGLSLGGLLGSKDPRAQYIRELMAALSPGAIQQNTNQFFKQFQTNAMPFLTTGAIGASNTLRNQLQNRMIGGAGGTGVGKLALSLASSSLGPMLNSYRLQGYQGAQNQAMDVARMLAGGLASGPAPYNMGGQIAGAGLSGLGDLARIYLNYRYPGKGGLYG